MIRYGLAALGALTIAGAAQAAPLSPTDIVNRHISSGGNVDAIMADYADDAVVLQAGRAFQGKDAIRGLFEHMFPKKPATDAAPAAPAASHGPMAGMKVLRVWQEGDVGFLTWQAGPINATEEFLVRNGRIAVQTIFMTGMPQPPAAH